MQNDGAGQHQKDEHEWRALGATVSHGFAVSSQFILIAALAIGLEVAVDAGEEHLPRYVYYWFALKFVAAVIFAFDVANLFRILWRHWRNS